MNAQAIQQEALINATTRESVANYPAIFEGFTAKGIPEADILPRVNVFTFAAWKALGRRVRKGEHGVRVTTVRHCTKREDDGTTSDYSLPWHTTVFHISQTDPVS